MYAIAHIKQSTEIHRILFVLWGQNMGFCTKIAENWKISKVKLLQNIKKRTDKYEDIYANLLLKTLSSKKKFQKWTKWTFWG